MKVKKLLAFLLALLMGLSLLAGCSSKSDSESASTSDASSEEGGEETEFLTMDPAGYPVLSEKTTFTVLAFATTPEGAGAWDTPNEIPFFANQEERTNIHFEWETLTSDAWTERVQTLIAGDDLPDVFLKARFSDADLTKNGTNGVLVNIQPYLDEYAPDLKAYLTDRDLEKYLVMGDGIWGMPYLYDSEGIRISKIFFNVDWLEAVGKEMPTNVDEMIDVMEAFRDNDANGNGDASDEIPCGAYDFYDLFAMFAGNYGLMNRGGTMGYSLYLDADPSDESGNTLRFWYTADEAQDLIKLGKSFVDEGYLPTSFFDSDYGTIWDTSISTNLYGFHDQWATCTGTYVDSYIAMDTVPTEVWTDVWGYVSTKGGLAITKECEHPEAMVAWGNYMYTTQGAYDYFLGIEGESYTVDDEGHTELTDIILNNPDGLEQEQALLRYSLYSGGCNPGLATDETFKGGETYKTSLDGNATFSAKAPEIVWEKFPLSTEQTSAVTSVKGDIDTVIGEYVAYFMTGVKDIDADWEEFQTKLIQAGIEDYVEAYQGAYNDVNGIE